MMQSTPSSRKPKPKTSVLQRQWEFEAIGTHFWIGIYQPVDDGLWAELQTSVAAVIDDFDANWSRFRPDSLVTRMSRRAGTYQLPAEGKLLLGLYRELYDATGGMVSPLVGNLLSDLGYDAQYSLRRQAEVQAVPVWQDALEIEGDILTVKRPVLLDVGAAGKGFLIDMIAERFKAFGLESYCIDGSGDMLVHGVVPALRVGIEDPADTTAVIGIAELADGALCVSAPNRRRWGNMHHIVRPDSGEPVQGIATTCVRAATAAVADGLATALFMVPPQRLQSAFDFDYLVLYDDYSVACSEGFPEQLFIQERR